MPPLVVVLRPIRFPAFFAFMRGFLDRSFAFFGHLFRGLMGVCFTTYRLDRPILFFNISPLPSNGISPCRKQSRLLDVPSSHSPLSPHLV